MRLTPPLNRWNLLILRGFQAPTGAEPPWKDKKNLSPPGQIPEYAPGMQSWRFNKDLEVSLEGIMLST